MTPNQYRAAIKGRGKMKLCTEKLTMAEWKKVGLELQQWHVPQPIVDAFEDDRDVGRFRFQCRLHGMEEDAIDFFIEELEAYF